MYFITLIAILQFSVDYGKYSQKKQKHNFAFFQISYYQKNLNIQISNK
jgi:hypothetical protein